jgi:hypothetical protein
MAGDIQYAAQGASAGGSGKDGARGVGSLTPKKREAATRRSPEAVSVSRRGVSVLGAPRTAAIEVKNAGTIRAKDLNSLRAFGHAYPHAQRLLLYRGAERLMIEGIRCPPCEQPLRDLVPGKPLPSRGRYEASGRPAGLVGMPDQEERVTVQASLLHVVPRLGYWGMGLA